MILSLLASSVAHAQTSFTFEELKDIYVNNDKARAIHTIESKGYTPASADDFRELFGTDLKGILYSRAIDASKIGIEFRDNKIYQVVFTDSVVSINSLLHEAEKTGFVLSHQEGEICKGYVKKRTSYFVWYSVLNGMPIETSMISIMEKTKSNRILYSHKW